MSRLFGVHDQVSLWGNEEFRADVSGSNSYSGIRIWDVRDEVTSSESFMLAGSATELSCLGDSLRRGGRRLRWL
jgi:hypothetical protein